MIWRFQNRSHAGKLLAELLASYKQIPDVVVLALPRGGVPVAYEIARFLDAPLDVFLVRKLGLPGFPEIAMGSVASGGGRYLDHELIATMRVTREQVDQETDREQKELARREGLYRAGRPPLDCGGRTVILVDDGVATGASMYVVLAALRRMHPARIVVAAPVAPECTYQELRLCGDDVVCLLTPRDFRAVGSFYEDFSEVSDEEVRRLLASAPHPSTALPA